MPYLSQEAMQYIQDELESKIATIDALEDELSAALESEAGLLARLQQLMSDRSMGV